MGPQAGGTSAHKRHGHPGTRSSLGQVRSMVFSQRKAESPRDRSNGPENYMDLSLRIWSRSPADLSRIPMNRMLGPLSNYLANNSPSTMARPWRKVMAWLTPPVAKTKNGVTITKDKPTLIYLVGAYLFSFT